MFYITLIPKITFFSGENKTLDDEEKYREKKEKILR